VTWRVWAATFLFLAIVAGGVVVIHWYAYSTYYLSEHNGFVAVFRGQPSGVLWYKPEVVVETNFPVTDLRIQDRRALNATISEPTEKEAVTYARNIYREFELGQTTTTTTTTTTKPGTTTTKATATTTTTKAAG
jgi:hypothetical protein